MKIRPRPYITAVIGTCTGALGFAGVVDAFVHDGSRASYSVPLLLLVGAIIGVTNFLRFCFLEISNQGIEVVNVFGLARRKVPARELREVRIEYHRNVLQRAIPSLIIMSTASALEFSVAKYHERDIARAHEALVKLGVPSAETHARALEMLKLAP